MFEIAEYANDSLNPSVTSGHCLWKKKERRSTDNPVPVNELSTSLSGSSRSEPPTTEYYDPCTGLLPDVNAFYEGLKFLQPNASMLLNRYKVDHTTPVKEDCTKPLLDYINRVIKEHPTISTISQLLGFILYSTSDITEIEKCTRSQSDNPMWMKYRKGMMTASSFHRVSKLKVSTDPDELIRFLMEGGSFVIVPAPLLRGRKKEIIARKWFFIYLRQSYIPMYYTPTYTHNQQ